MAELIGGLGVILAVLGYVLMVRIGDSIRRDRIAEAAYDSGRSGPVMVWLAWALMIGGATLFLFAAVSMWRTTP